MKKIIICLMLLLLYISSTYMAFCVGNNGKIAAVSISNDEEKVSEIDDLHKYRMKVYYPVSGYKKLDNEVKSIIYDYVMDFKDNLKDVYVQENFYYTLDINYDKYVYKNYISYVFYIETYLGGAHPDHLMTTINYDTNRNMFITINDLIKNNDDILEKMSVITREKLLISNKFSGNSYVIDMFKDGTSPRTNNYKNFVLTDKGIKIFFNYYQIAPYYLGISEVTIPYEKLNLNI